MPDDESQLLFAREHDRAQLCRDTSAGSLVRVRRGAYRPHDDDATMTPETLARAHIAAVHRQLAADHVFSHESAALLWGVPLWHAPTATHVLQRSGSSSRSARDVVRHRGLPEHRLELEGLPVTDLTRTVVDCVTTLQPLCGLVVADWALGQGLDRDAATALLARRGRCHGAARGRVVLGLADRGAFPPWETWLRYLALRAGLPRPVTQFPVETNAGRFFVDLAWPEHRVLAEFDGRIKYRDDAFGPGYDGERALFDEKVREDAIVERLGVRPLRFVARHVSSPDDVARRLLARFPAEVRQSARINPRLPLPPQRVRP